MPPTPWRELLTCPAVIALIFAQIGHNWGLFIISKCESKAKFVKTSAYQNEMIIFLILFIELRLFTTDAHSQRFAQVSYTHFETALIIQVQESKQFEKFNRLLIVCNFFGNLDK